MGEFPKVERRFADFLPSVVEQGAKIALGAALASWFGISEPTAHAKTAGGMSIPSVTLGQASDRKRGQLILRVRTNSEPLFAAHGSHRSHSSHSSHRSHSSHYSGSGTRSAPAPVSAPVTKAKATPTPKPTPAARAVPSDSGRTAPLTLLPPEAATPLEMKILVVSVDTAGLVLIGKDDAAVLQVFELDPSLPLSMLPRPGAAVRVTWKAGADGKNRTVTSIRPQ